jgi:hypothetical protein
MTTIKEQLKILADHGVEVNAKSGIYRLDEYDYQEACDPESPDHDENIEIHGPRVRLDDRYLKVFLNDDPNSEYMDSIKTAKDFELAVNEIYANLQECIDNEWINEINIKQLEDQLYYIRELIEKHAKTEDEKKVLVFLNDFIENTFDITVFLSDIKNSEDWTNWLDEEMQLAFENDLLKKHNVDSLQEIFSDNMYSNVEEIRQVYNKMTLSQQKTVDYIIINE